MPVYAYEVLGKNGEVVEIFEADQRIGDPPLTHHPVTGESMRKVLRQGPSLTLNYSDQATASRIGDANLRKSGFSKYVKDMTTGRYHRILGDQGPEVVDPG